jgi:hypothetical protein
MTYRPILPFLFFFTLTLTAFAQDFLKMAEEKDSKRDSKSCNILSIDGKSQKVKIMPDYVHRVLKISCLRDTININDYWGVPPEINILNKNFIAIKYAIRGGSNVGLDNILIVCVNHNKLYRAMFALNDINSETGDEKEIYNITFVLTGTSKKSFHLNVNIHDEVNSQSRPETNYNYHEQTVLHFDDKRNVFYSIKKDIYGSFTVGEGKRSIAIRGNFPVIMLGRETYYFLDNEWFQMGIPQHIYKFY